MYGKQILHWSIYFYLCGWRFIDKIAKTGGELDQYQRLMDPDDFGQRPFCFSLPDSVEIQFRNWN